MNPQTFQRLLTPLWQQPWVVYVKPPFASAQHVLSYLGRYTHRVALSNDRLVALCEDRVVFRWRDRRRGNRTKVMTLTADEFIRRFLLHVLPILRGAIAQRLVPDLTGEGRVPASEVMVVTGRVPDLILNPEETGKITEVIGEGEFYGMRTFDQSLLGYVMEGKISEEVALDYASSPHDFKLMLAAGGQRASGIEQLGTPDGPAVGQPAS